MQTKDAWAGEEWNLINAGLELLHVLSCWDSVIKVGPREEELLVLIEDEVTHELVEVGHKHASVPVVRYTTSVHGITDEVPHCFPGKRFLLPVARLVQVKHDELERDSEVGVVEVVVDVPSDLSILLSLLDGGVEEGQDIAEGLELFFRAFVEVFVFQLRHVLPDVSTETIRRLSDDLETLLQDTQRELVLGCSVDRHRSQPQSVALVWLVQVFNDLVELLEP